MKDYRVKITMRNDRLLSAIEDQDFPSVAQFCAANCLDYQRITEIIRGKLKPLNQKGEPIPLVCNLLDILNISLEDAFTQRQLQGFHKTSYQMRVVEKDLKKLLNPAHNQEQKMIEKDVKMKLVESFAKRLNPREEQVIRLKYGFDKGHEHTDREIGKILGVSGGRAGQIRARAERKLKHPSVANGIINTGFNEVYTKVKITPKQIKNAENVYS
tara:strand:+ start:81 stop:722 length:642 start_codon:yes stop_codon:yes gene_type:complete